MTRHQTLDFCGGLVVFGAFLVVAIFAAGVL